MPFVVNIDRKSRLIESRWDGPVTLELLTAYIDKVWADPTVLSFSEFADMRGIDEVEISSEDVRKFAAYSRQFDNPPTPTRSAVITSPGLVYGLARMFSIIRSLDPADRRVFKVFKDVDAGRRWLGSP